jgi:hypothetical protein
MITITATNETKASLADALTAHLTDDRLTLGLKRLRREDKPLTVLAMVSPWPADADGFYRIALSDHAGVIAYRAFMMAEINAGRGRLSSMDDYHDLLAIETEPAYEFVCLLTKGRGIRPCSDADHDSWSKATRWVVTDGNAKDPSAKWARSTWRGRAHAHEVYAAVGLAVPGRGKWYPLATMLFRIPMARPLPQEKQLLTDEEAEQLAAIAR